jgi:hypothetical protein
MRKIVVALGMSLLLLGAGCEQEEPTEAEETPEESPSPSPEVMGTFQLQGRALEALASVAATPGPGTTPTPAATPTPQATPTPTGSPAATPSPTPTVQATPTPTGTPGAGAIQDGAPGSLSIRLTAFSGSDTTCSFQAGDTVVVAFTRATQYTPADLETNDRFPRNLRETNVSVQGTVADEESCVLIAESVSTQAPGTPTPGAAGASPTPTATLSPTGTPSPGATPSPSPTE